ncbi:hypothetical protein MA9V1_126 [Chryseobacterium phage MA9V-1]|nr:hypothetical protein MA9V1_126 [Chryseobacterium phage MA9V-1]
MKNFFVNEAVTKHLSDTVINGIQIEWFRRFDDVEKDQVIEIVNWSFNSIESAMGSKIKSIFVDIEGKNVIKFNLANGITYCKSTGRMYKGADRYTWDFVGRYNYSKQAWDVRYPTGDTLQTNIPVANKALIGKV